MYKPKKGVILVGLLIIAMLLLATTKIPLQTVAAEEKKCPTGCECLTEEQAKQKLGSYEKCSEEPCGYEYAPTAAARIKIVKYCFKKAEPLAKPKIHKPVGKRVHHPLAVCPDRCRCITESEAKRLGLTYCRNEKKLCGYDEKQRPLYCYQEEEPVCPSGCECMTEAVAREKLGTYVRCSHRVCGHDPQQNPMYCFTKVEECPQGCECWTEREASEKGLSLCQGRETLCGYVVPVLTAPPESPSFPKYCYERKLPTIAAKPKPVELKLCPEGCVCLSKDEGYKLGMEFCLRDNNPIRCATIDVEHGIYKYCFRRPVVEEICPEGCRCLSIDEVTKYEEEGVGLSRCAEKICGYTERQEPKYCYRIEEKRCRFNFRREICVGPCPPGKFCHLNTLIRDPETGEIIKAECTCKAYGEKCEKGCYCLTKEEAYKRFKRPELCEDKPCGRKAVTYATAARTAYELKYCFREGVEEKCYYDREKQRCVGVCVEEDRKGECKLFRDSYGSPYCDCVFPAPVEVEEPVWVARLLPKEAEPVSCFPVRLIVAPRREVSGIIVTDTYPIEFQYAGASPEPDKKEGNTLKWLLRRKEGVEKEEITYKLCVPMGAAGAYPFVGGWEIEGQRGETKGDKAIGIIASQENWPPCPVSDQELLRFVEAWAKGELSDLMLLQVIHIWAHPEECEESPHVG